VNAKLCSRFDQPAFMLDGDHLTLKDFGMSNDHDHLYRFMLEHAGVRGVWVRLKNTWQDIQARADYPAPVLSALGQACTAAALFTGHIKVNGRLSVQLRGSGVLRTLFAECTSAGTLRGIAHYQAPLPDVLTPSDFGDDAMLVITIETQAPGAAEPVRYQGIVGLEAESLSLAFEGYFLQSEQLPTRLILAADASHTTGLLLQQLPKGSRDNDAWPRISALFDTLHTDELMSTDHETLLWRLFHEEQVQIQDSQSLRFGCSCSQARVEDMMKSLGQTEATAALEDGLATIHCDFCGQAYVFNEESIKSLFEQAPLVGPGSNLLQ
jgi:molecular chaperone Hsp33